MTTDVNDRLKGPDAGNGVTVAFGFDFLIKSTSELRVTLRSSAGIDTEQVLGTDFTATGVDDPAGGTVTFMTAPPAGSDVIIEGVTPRNQSTAYTSNDRFPSASHEATVDRAMRIDQEQDSKIARAPLLPAGVSPAEPLPYPVEGGLLGWASGAWTWLTSVLDGAAVSSFMGNVLLVQSAHAFAKIVSGSLTLKTYAQARLLTGLSEDVNYQLLGRLEPGDGAEGSYYYDASDTTTADDGGYCLVVADGGRLKRNAKVLHTLQFCAGDADAADGLDACFAYLGQLPVRIDPVDHMCSRELAVIAPATSADPVGLDLRGEGQRSRILYNGADTTPGDLLTFGELGTQREGAMILDFVVGSTTTQEAGAGKGVHIIDWNNGQIDIQINGGGKLWDGLYLEGCNYWWLCRTLISVLNDGFSSNDCVDVDFMQLQLLPAAQEQGRAFHIGGGVGGLYGGQAKALLWETGVKIDLGLVRRYTGLTATTANGSATLTAVSGVDWAKIKVGQQILGTNIPAGALVADKPTSSTILMTAPATGAATVSDIEVYKGNEQIDFEDMQVDYSAGHNLEIDDDSLNPISKVINLANAKFTSAYLSNIKTTSYPGGVIRGGDGQASYSRTGDGIENDESDIIYQLGSNYDLSHNAGDGMSSSVDIEVLAACIPYNNSGLAWSETIVRRSAAGYAGEKTVVDGGTFAFPAVSGILLIANDTSGLAAEFMLAAGTVTELEDPGSDFEVSSTPTKTGIYFSSPLYRAKQNTGAPARFLWNIRDVRASV
jgi:hypothetical protein